MREGLGSLVADCIVAHNAFLSPLQAQQMLSACQEKIDVSNTEGYDLFITQLKEGLKNTSHETAANHKVAKVSQPHLS